MRRLYATAIDVVLAGVLGFAGFRVAEWAAPCPNHSDCLIFAPLVILGVLTGVAAYFAATYSAWKTTLGEHLFDPK